MYLTGREQLKRVVLLVDSRHKPTGDDIMMNEWFKHFGYNVAVVATKSDKLTKNDLKKSEKVIKETLKLGSEDKLYFFSSLNRNGADELINNLFLEFATDLD